MSSRTARCDCSRELPAADKFGQQVCECGRRWRDGRLIAWPRAVTFCRYLGERTGETWACSTCGGHSGRVPIYECVVQGTCLIRQPAAQPGGGAWQGGVCTHCELRDDWPA